MTGNVMAAVDENDWIGQNQGSVNGDEKKFNGLNKNIVNFCKNKNNIVVEVPPVVNRDCEECFAENIELKVALEEFLLEFDTFIDITITRVEGVEFLLITPDTNTIEQLCAQLENAVEEGLLPISDDLLRFVLLQILGKDFETQIEELIECLLEKGVIVDRELNLPGISIFDNRIDDGLQPSMNVECICDNPICDQIRQ